MRLLKSRNCYDGTVRTIFQEPGPICAGIPGEMDVDCCGGSAAGCDTPVYAEETNSKGGVVWGTWTMRLEYAFYHSLLQRCMHEYVWDLALWTELIFCGESI